MSRISCATCGGKSFTENDTGFMVCDDCDTLSQDIRQEFAEVEDMRSGRRTTRHKGKRPVKMVTVTETKTGKYGDKDSRDTFLHLSTKIVITMIKSVMAYIPSPTFEQEARELLLKYLRMKLEHLDAAEESEPLPEADATMRTATTLLVSPLTAAAICYVALRRIRAAITISEIVVQILSGTISYFTLYDDLPKDSTWGVSLKYTHGLKPLNLPTCFGLRGHIRTLYRWLKLDVWPPPPALLIIQKMASVKTSRHRLGNCFAVRAILVVIGGNTLGLMVSISPYQQRCRFGWFHVQDMNVNIS
eukprot:m.122893 g.122893  ORF g.122893 m.122893 type:complete len:303 (+) comp28945_c2_seq1:137-1045(+)